MKRALRSVCFLRLPINAIALILPAGHTQDILSGAQFRELSGILGTGSNRLQVLHAVSDF